MLRSRLNDFLVKNIWLQIVICVLPVILTSIYVFVYLFDLSGIVFVLDKNRTQTEEDLKWNNLYEVSSYELNEDDTYKCKVIKDDTVALEVNSGDIIFNIELTDEISSKFYTTDKVWNVDNFMLFDEIITNEDGTYTVKVNNKELNVSKGSTVYEVKLIDYNNFEYVYNDDTTEIVESCPCISIDYKNKDKFSITIKTAFEKTFDNLIISYTDNLPSDNIYYNATSDVFIKNISSDFDNNFMLGSNFFTVCLSMIGMLVLLFILRKKTDYKVLGTKYPFKINAIAIGVSLLLLFTITKLLL